MNKTNIVLYLSVHVKLILTIFLNYQFPELISIKTNFLYS